MVMTAPRTKAARPVSTETADFAPVAEAVTDVELAPAQPEIVEPVVRPGSRDFDPVKHLITLQHNAKYLPVSKRLLWLRSEQPEAHIQTELIQLSEKFALFKATVTLPGGANATGYGSETPGDFGDFIEKAETKALGRALAALGYGTQFCQDFDFDGDGQHFADTPIGKNGFFGAMPGNGVTDKQLKAIFAIGRETLGLSDAEIDARCDEMFRCAPEQLSKADASRFIDVLKRDATA